MDVLSVTITFSQLVMLPLTGLRSARVTRSLLSKKKKETKIMSSLFNVKSLFHQNNIQFYK